MVGDGWVMVGELIYAARLSAHQDYSDVTLD